MTMYTVMPMDQVWEGAWSSNTTVREMSFEGMLMEVEPLDEGRARIIRLLYCPLSRYLDPGLAPGTIIPFIPGRQ
jgi:hypothetical protein